MILKVSVYQRIIGEKKKWGIRYRLKGKDIKEIIGTSKRQAEIAAAAKTKQLFDEKFDIPQRKNINLEDGISSILILYRDVSCGEKST